MMYGFGFFFDTLSAQESKDDFVFYISFHVVYMFSINIQPDHNIAAT